MLPDNMSQDTLAATYDSTELTVQYKHGYPKEVTADAKKQRTYLDGRVVQVGVEHDDAECQDERRISGREHRRILTYTQTEQNKTKQTNQIKTQTKHGQAHAQGGAPAPFVGTHTTNMRNNTLHRNNITKHNAGKVERTAKKQKRKSTRCLRYVLYSAALAAVGVSKRLAHSQSTTNT